MRGGEHLDNHTARLTVEIDEKQLADAKAKAARKISQKYNIPGFRKGKAPYNMIVKHFGEAAILEEAVDELGQDAYRAALTESGIEPYGPGNLEDIKLEPAPVFTYTVPKVPTVDLGDYRSVRVDYAPPTVEDGDVERELRMMQMSKGTFTEKTDAITVGDRVTVDLHSFFVTEGEEDAPEDEAAEHDHEHDHDHDHDHDSAIDDPKYQRGESYMHEHDAQMILTEGDDEPIAPGFTQSLVGASAGELREFVIEYPENDDISPEVRGKRVQFVVQVKQVESSELPEINDEFADGFADTYGDKPAEGEEAQPLTLDRLRVKVREAIEKEATTRYNDDYGNRVLDKVVEQAAISYPEDLIQDEINNLLKYLEDNLKSQGASLDIYKQVTGKSDEDMRADYRDTAINRVRRSLVFSDLVEKERIGVTNEELEAQIDKLARQYSSDEAQIESLRNTFRSRNLLESIINRLGEEKSFARLAAIGRGEAPDLTVVETAETVEGKEEAGETVESSETAGDETAASDEDQNA